MEGEYTIVDQVSLAHTTSPSLNVDILPNCDRSYARGNLGLPDQATFLIENTVFGQGVSLEANHHCAAGLTGVLCFPTYMLHNVQWKNMDTSKKWMRFQWEKLQPHNANQNHGGVFTLSPPDAQHVMNGGEIEHSIFPHPYVSLVSSKFTCK